MTDLHFACITATDPADDRQFPPLAFGYLSAFLRENLSGVFLHEISSEQLTGSTRYDGLMISSVSPNFNIARAIAAKGKALGMPVIVGGVHISLLPKTLPAEMDIGIVGEGEQTLTQLLRHRMQSGGFSSDGLEEINGLVYHVDNEIKLTPPREKIDDLDRIPHPERAKGQIATRAHVVTSRGCPYRCSFCASRALWGAVRVFSADYVLEEVDELVEKGAEQIHFFDDLFIANKKRFYAIADGIISRGYPGKITFSCAVRAELCNEQLFDTLAEMGVREITYGAESASGPVLRFLKGGDCSPEANQRVLDLAFQRGITCSASFIKGVPGETGADLMATHEFLIDNIRSGKLRYFDIHPLAPFPGTEIWNIAQKRGIVSDEMDWEQLRRPWEQLYMGDALPKASFYFFENLARIAKRMLSIFSRKRICLILGTGDSKALQCALEERAFFDRIERLSENDLADRTFDEENAFYAICRPSENFDISTLINMVWAFHLGASAVMVHGGWRHFSPVSDFEKNLALFGSEVMQKAAGLIAKGEPDVYSALVGKGIDVAIYRPDLDPYVKSTPAERAFIEELTFDFKLGELRKKRDERMLIVENRIMEKSARMQDVEKKIAGFRTGIWKHIGRRFPGFEALLRRLYYRDE